MTKMKLILTLLLITGTISRAQTPPLPPMPNMAMQANGQTPRVVLKTNVTVELLPTKAAPMFTVNCPHCEKTFKHMPALNIATSGNSILDGSNLVTRTILFSCPDCGSKISAKNTKLIPQAIAIEEEVPMSGGGASMVSPAWTTDPNLRLSIQYTNCPFSTTSNGASILIGPDAQSGPMGYALCGPTVRISYPTEIGKTYKCQASDDAKKTWIDGPIVPGTGMPVVQYEAAIKTNRIYRVVEL